MWSLQVASEDEGESEIMYDRYERFVRLSLGSRSETAALHRRQLGKILGLAGGIQELFNKQEAQESEGLVKAWEHKNFIIQI